MIPHTYESWKAQDALNHRRAAAVASILERPYPRWKRNEEVFWIIAHIRGTNHWNLYTGINVFS